MFIIPTLIFAMFSSIYAQNLTKSVWRPILKGLFLFAVTYVQDLIGSIVIASKSFCTSFQFSIWPTGLGWLIFLFGFINFDDFSRP